MKNFNLNLIAILIFYGTVFAQSEKIFIVKDDATTFEGDRTCMFVGQKTEIACEICHLFNVKCDNGKVVSQKEEGTWNYYIIPKRNGPVNISAKYIEKGDTLTIKEKFTAITPPRLEIKLIKDNYKIDKRVILKIVDRKTHKELSTRYTIGRIPLLTVFDSANKFIGDMLTNADTIDFSRWSEFSDQKILPGYTFRCLFDVRDIQTDLLISTNEFVYRFK